jgi:site-specific DNA-methyltransferase (adenine-specific)
MKLTLLQGNVFEQLPKIESESVDLVITSPPYWGLRDYGTEGQLGLEPTMEAYLDNTMRWVREVWRVLKPTGSFVLNMGDCFIGGGRGAKPVPASLDCNHAEVQQPSKLRGGIYKPKQLLSVSSFAYCKIVSETDFVCRGEHIWCKPNVPSPIRSRLKHSHEKLFWFVKDADKYYFDKKAWLRKVEKQVKRNEVINPTYDVNNLSETSAFRTKKWINENTIEHSWRIVPVGAKANGFELSGKLPSQHIAPYPTKLIEPYIFSLCPWDGTILDPFLGSGTTMRIAMEAGKNCIGIELDDKCIPYIKARMNWGQGMGTEYSEAMSKPG